ncbi:MAG: hypothetical protein ACQKBT_00785, partial [Puniceicoccales bacterium]
LQYDLSIALDNQLPELSGPIFEDPDSPGVDFLGGYGPDWELVKSFWLLREDADDGVIGIRGHRSHQWDPSLYSNLGRILSDNYGSPSAETTLAPQAGVSPLVTSFHLYFFASIEPAGSQLVDGDLLNTYQARLDYLPEITIWNPYNVTLTGDLLMAISTSGATKFKMVVDLLELPEGETPESDWSDAEVDSYRMQDPDGDRLLFDGFRFFALWNQGHSQDLRFKLPLPSGGLAPGEALTFRLAEPIERPGPYKVVELSSDVVDFGAGIYEVSDLRDPDENVGYFDPDLSGNDYFLNMRIRNTDSETASLDYDALPFYDHSANYNQAWVAFRLYTYDDDTVGDLLQYQMETIVGTIPGFQNTDNPSITSYSISMTSPRYTDIDLSTGFSNADRVDGTNFAPYFGFEIALPFNEVAALDKSPLDINHHVERLYGYFNLRSPRYVSMKSASESGSGGNDARTHIGYTHYTDQMLYAYEPNFGGGVLGPRDWSEGGNGVSQMSLFDLPSSDEPFTTVGQLSHLNLVDTAYGPNIQVGNSQPSIYLDPWDLKNTDGDFADWAYLANDALWDRYFFSTYSSVWGDAQIRHPLYEVSESVLDDPSEWADPETSAANILVNGRFNINSTSVEAWKVFLSTYLSDSQALITDVSSENVSDHAVFLRPQSPLQQSLDESGVDTADFPTNEELYAGYRALSMDEVDSLAINLVEEVKKRGPFLSVAEFVNRAYVPDSSSSNALDVVDDATIVELANNTERMGALQSAIERSGLNQSLNAGVNYQAPGDASNVLGDYSSLPKNPPAGAGSFFQDAPGYLSQSDILARMGSLVSARSDVFVIRSYGRVTNPIDPDEVTGEVWLEAIVQRIPEPVEPSETNPLEPEDPQTMGRKFEVIAFRWLNQDDV